MAEFNLWLLIVGIAAGAAVMWLVIGTVARNDDDEASEERELEAGWIAETIEQHGGRAPVALVEQILALHRRYLQGGPGIPVPQGEPDEPEAEPPAEAAETGAAIVATGEEADQAESGATEGKARKRPREGRPRTASKATEAQAR